MGTSSMAEEMSLKQLPLTLIVAAAPKNGIGNSGGLPWPMLKKEMAYFARVTKRTPTTPAAGSVLPDVSKQEDTDQKSSNVVIMGRKTWEASRPNSALSRTAPIWWSAPSPAQNWAMYRTRSSWVQ